MKRCENVSERYVTIEEAICTHNYHRRFDYFKNGLFPLLSKGDQKRVGIMKYALVLIIFGVGALLVTPRPGKSG